ncbi:MAG: aldo/keto reductase [Methylococcaceae bacterium]|nr:aldo/keto reductase [Methylococcaceae bacterium]
MEYRILGRTGLRVSAIGIGTWQLSGPLTLDGKADGFPDPGEDKVIDLIHACADLGINVIDSAEIYGDGEGERRVGKAIQGARERWIISSKFGLRKGEDGKAVRNVGPETIRTRLENSLRRLQTDYLDIYLYHSRPDNQSLGEAKLILETLKREGKLRFYGISTNSPKVLGQLLDHQCVDVVMFSQSLLTDQPKLLQLAREHELGVLVRGALESGKLSGQYFHEPPRLKDDDIRQRGFSGIDLQKYSVYEPFLPPGVSMATFAIRYLLDHATTHSIILGGKSVEQYREALAALSLPRLDPQTHEALQKLRETLSNKPWQRKMFDRLARWFDWSR